MDKDRGGCVEAFGEWTVCTVTMPNDRNAPTPNQPPAMICGTFSYKNSNTIRYRLCTEMAHLKGSVEREQLKP
jgi:hypothetical protein